MTRREKLAAAMRENIQAMKEGRPSPHPTIRLADYQDDEPATRVSPDRIQHMNHRFCP